MTRVYHNDASFERSGGLRLDLEGEAAVGGIAYRIAVEFAGISERQAQSQSLCLSVRYPRGGGDYLAARNADLSLDISGMAEGEVEIFSVEHGHGIERAAGRLRRREIRLILYGDIKRHLPGESELNRCRVGI